MKIQITLKIKTNSDAASAFDIVVGCSESVADVKERVASVQPLPFPQQDLYFNGKVLPNDAKLSQCGVVEGSDVKLEVKADETTLAQQLAELLQARDLSADELGLLYCYKFGASINEALKLLAFEGKLSDFVTKQKTLTMNGSSVSLLRADTSLKPFSAADEIVQILQASPSGYMEIKELSSKFTQKFGASLASIAGCRPVEFLSKNSLFVVHGNHKHVSLQGARKKQVDALTPQSAEVTIDAPAGLDSAPPGLGGAPPGLGSIKDDTPSYDVDTQQYSDLHNKISSRDFNAKATQTINDFVSAVSDGSFLDIDHVVIGGSIGKGTATSGAATADIVLFARGLPFACYGSWLSPLLKALAGTLSEEASVGIEDISVSEEMVKLCIDDISVNIYVSPVFDNYAMTVQAIAAWEHPSGTLQSAALSKERTKFISRQPSSVKITIRLMKWWRDQQQWSGQMSFPSDEILELATIYSSIQTKPPDQKTAIANVMSLLSQFSRLRVVWSNFYSKDDVSAPLLRQRPLLMDPTNPYLNVADPQNFDAHELMALARSTHFFW
jgi:hypothetical protein